MAGLPKLPRYTTPACLAWIGIMIVVNSTELPMLGAHGFVVGWSLVFIAGLSAAAIKMFPGK